MPTLRSGSKEGFEPVLPSLRVRHSTAELPRSTSKCRKSPERIRVCLYYNSPSVCLSVGVRKLQVEFLARSSREMFLTVRIV